MERGKIIEHLKSVVRFIIVEKQNIKFLQILISQILYAALYLNISIYVYFIRTSIFFILAHTLRRVHNFIVSIQIKWHINVNYIYINIIYIYTYELLPKSSRNWNAARKPPVYSCVLLGIASCTLYKPLCQAAFCCEDVSVSSVHFCGVVLVLFCDRTDLLK